MTLFNRSMAGVDVVSLRQGKSPRQGDLARVVHLCQRPPIADTVTLRP